MINLPRNRPAAFFLNYPEFPDSWSGFKLAFSIHIFDMFIVGADILGKQIRHLFLTQPDTFFLKMNLQ